MYVLCVRGAEEDSEMQNTIHTNAATLLYNLKDNVEYSTGHRSIRDFSVKI
jgi:hypothetical protein